LSRQKDRKGQVAVNIGQSHLKLARNWPLDGLNKSLDSPKHEKENPVTYAQIPRREFVRQRTI